MQKIGEYKLPTILKDHPPVMQRLIMASGSAEATYLAGTVLGRDTSGNLVQWTKSCASAEGILAEDVTVPATGGKPVDVYVHASVWADALIWPDETSAADIKTGLKALRAAGIYA